MWWVAPAGCNLVSHEAFWAVWIHQTWVKKTVTFDSDSNDWSLPAAVTHEVPVEIESLCRKTYEPLMADFSQRSSHVSECVVALVR